jgi:PAS domain S-box-containing protein
MVGQDDLWIVSPVTDATGQCLSVDDTWTAATGRPRSEALGFGWLDVLHPDDRVYAIETFGAALKRQAAFRHEFRVRRHDGAYRWALAVWAPRFDGAEFLGHAGAIIDVHASRLARQRVKESEEKLRLALDSAEMGTFVWQADDRRCEQDMRMLELFGLPPDASLSLHSALDHSILQEDRARFMDALTRARRPGGDGRLREDVRIRRPDGTLRWLQISAQAHFAGEPRRPLLMVGAAMDITAREQAKEALEAGQERHAFLLKLSDVLRHAVDPVEVQKNGATLLGRRLRASRVQYGEVSDDGAWAVVRDDFCDGTPSVVGRHYLESYKPLVLEELRAGRTLVVDDVETDPRLTPEVRTATRALDIGAYAIAPLLKSGRVVALLVVQFRAPHRWSEADVSLVEEVGERTWAAVERAMALERLAVAHERLTATLKASPIVAFEQDRDLRYVWIENPARGYGAEDRVGKTDYDLFERPEDAEALTAIKRRVLETGAPARKEVQVFRDGVLRWYDLIVEPRRTGNKIVGVLCTATDITEHKHTEAALKEADRRKNEFLAVLGHELRNPLASIRYGVQRLKATDLSPDLQSTIDLMARQIGHLVRLSDDLLDVSRINQDRIELRREPLDLAATLRDAVDALRPQSEEKGQRLKTRFADKPLIVTGDATRLSQVAANLIGNAIKNTEPGGEICATVDRRGDEAVLTVRDNGAGIPPDVLPRLFDLFIQADRTDQRGLGIGLALSKRLVELHGGAIEAHSDGVGKGSAFIVRLPLGASSCGDVAGAPAAPVGSQSGASVLVIDDNRDVADSFAMLLRSFDLAVEVAYDGETGVAAASALSPDIVFVDIRMPGIDGYETARRIRALTPGRKPMLVALSALGLEERQQLLDGGFDSHRTKPVGADAIAEIVAQSASQRRSDVDRAGAL